MAELFVLLSGRDDSLADTIYARQHYPPRDILWGRRFVDVISMTPDGRRVVDLTRFHDTEASWTRRYLAARRALLDVGDRACR